LKYRFWWLKLIRCPGQPEKTQEIIVRKRKILIFSKK